MYDFKSEGLNEIVKRNFNTALGNLSENINNTKAYLNTIQNTQEANEYVILIERFMIFYQYLVANDPLTEDEINTLTYELEILTAITQDVLIEEGGQLRDKQQIIERIKNATKSKAVEFERFNKPYCNEELTPIIEECERLLSMANSQVQEPYINQTLTDIKNALNFFQTKLNDEIKTFEFYKIKNILTSVSQTLHTIIKPSINYSRRVDEMYQHLKDYEAQIQNDEDQETLDEQHPNEESHPIIKSNIYDICQKKLNALREKIAFIEGNKKAHKLVLKTFNDVKNATNKIKIKDFQGNTESLLALEENINSLTETIWTDDVAFEFQLCILRNFASESGLTSIFARFLQPENEKIFRDSMARIEDAKFTKKANTKTLVKTLELTNDYLKFPSDKNLFALNHFINKNLPENSHTKFYLKALAVSLICSAMIATLVVISIYNPTAAQLMAPVYQNIGHVFANLIATFPPVAKIGAAISDPIVAAGEHTAFVMPGISPFAAHEAVPVWSLVAGATAGAVTGIVAAKVASKLKGASGKNIEDGARSEVSGLTASNLRDHNKTRRSDSLSFFNSSESESTSLSEQGDDDETTSLTSGNS